MYVLDQKLRKLGIPLQTPVFYIKKGGGLKGHILQGHVFLMYHFQFVSLEQDSLTL